MFYDIYDEFIESSPKKERLFQQDGPEKEIRDREYEKGRARERASLLPIIDKLIPADGIPMGKVAIIRSSISLGTYEVVWGNNFVAVNGTLSQAIDYVESAEGQKFRQSAIDLSKEKF